MGIHLPIGSVCIQTSPNTRVAVAEGRDRRTEARPHRRALQQININKMTRL